MIAYIAAVLTVGILLFVVRTITDPEPEDYSQCRGLDKVED
jgi:hypothetical protein